MSLSKIYHFFFSTKQILFNLESADKIKNDFRLLFFYFQENYSRKVYKSTNKKILALPGIILDYCILLNFETSDEESVCKLKC